MKLLGHRGARHEAPENTLAGIELAIAAGAEGIEIDVHRARDGALVVIHDETLDRTTDGTGPVAERTLAELRRLDAGDGERIPTLEEVLRAVRGRLQRTFVELKAPDCEEAVVKVIRAEQASATCLVKSFNHRWVRRVKQLAPELPTGCLLVGIPVDPVSLVRAAEADALSLSTSTVDAELVRACHQAGIEVCAWNCNDPAQLPGFAELGLDWLATDRPSTIVPAWRAR